MPMDPFLFKLGVYFVVFKRLKFSVELLIQSNFSHRDNKLHRNYKLCVWFDVALFFIGTVRDIVFGTGHCFWDSGYLCHFSTEIAEIWSPGTFFKDVWAYKISAQNLLYFRSYKIFSGGKSEAKIGLELRELKFITKY